MKLTSTPRARRKRRANNSEAVSAELADNGAVPTRPVDPDAPRWTRLPRPGESLRGLSRSFIYQLCALGKVRSIVVRGEIRGRSRKSDRGVRLLCIRSLDAYLSSIAAEQWTPAEPTAENAA